MRISKYLSNKYRGLEQEVLRLAFQVHEGRRLASEQGREYFGELAEVYTSPELEEIDIEFAQKWKRGEITHKTVFMQIYQSGQTGIIIPSTGRRVFIRDAMYVEPLSLTQLLEFIGEPSTRLDAVFEYESESSIERAATNTERVIGYIENGKQFLTNLLGVPIQFADITSGGRGAYEVWTNLEDFAPNEGRMQIDRSQTYYEQSIATLVNRNKIREASNIAKFHELEDVYSSACTKLVSQRRESGMFGTTFYLAREMGIPTTINEKELALSSSVFYNGRFTRSTRNYV